MIIILFIISCIIAATSKKLVRCGLIGTAVYTFIAMLLSGSAYRAGQMLLPALFMSVFIVWLPIGMVAFWRQHYQPEPPAQLPALPRVNLPRESCKTDDQIAREIRDSVERLRPVEPISLQGFDYKEWKKTK
jgi:hypothetical protein